VKKFVTDRCIVEVAREQSKALGPVQVKLLSSSPHVGIVCYRECHIDLLLPNVELRGRQATNEKLWKSSAGQ
jgi:hypothetical protein